MGDTITTISIIIACYKKHSVITVDDEEHFLINFSYFYEEMFYFTKQTIILKFLNAFNFPRTLYY